jgi:hypothetical protein
VRIGLVFWSIDIASTHAIFIVRSKRASLSDQVSHLIDRETPIDSTGRYFVGPDLEVRLTTSIVAPLNFEIGAVLLLVGAQPIAEYEHIGRKRQGAAPRPLRT